MRLGTLDRLIEIHRYTPPNEEIWPLPEPTYEYAGSEWMAKKPLRADEKFATDVNQRYADVLVRFTSYPIDGLTILDRLKDEDGRFYDIKAIVEIGYCEGLEIDAKLI